MKPTVFIHTNAKQLLGAIVSQHSLKRNSKRPDAFDVKILSREDFDFFEDKEGQPFTPLRFMAPEKMGYEGRAVIIDPDVFAVGDIVELLERDMEGKAIMAVPRFGHNKRENYVATSVMLLDCAKLNHWHCETMFNELFEHQRDYGDWIDLADEDPDSIGFLLHNTKRKTQPWRPVFRWTSPCATGSSVLSPGLGFRPKPISPTPMRAKKPSSSVWCKNASITV